MKRPFENLGWMMSGGFAEFGGKMRHPPPEKRADMHHKHRSWQATREHKFHKAEANPRSGLVQLRASRMGFETSVLSTDKKRLAWLGAQQILFVSPITVISGGKDNSMQGGISLEYQRYSWERECLSGGRREGMGTIANIAWRMEAQRGGDLRSPGFWRRKIGDRRSPPLLPRPPEDYFRK